MAVGDRTVAVRLLAETSGYVSGMNQAALSAWRVERQTQKTGVSAKRSMDGTAASAGRLGNVMAGLGGIVAIGLGAKALGAVMDFDDAMARLGAASMETGDALADMRDVALKAGQDTVFTAAEAADGMTELSKAGVSTADIMGGALAGSLDLAAAGELDVGFAAETAATAMVQFNRGGEEMSHIADLLAAGAGKAQGDVEDLALALRQGGQVASMVGWTLEDTTTTLTAFAAAGLLGSDAGTSLKTMLLRLARPSKQAQEIMDRYGFSVYDATGNMVGASEMAGRLTTAFADLDPQARNAAMGVLFGTDAVRAANVLYANGEKGVLEWSAAVNDSGYAAEVAAKKNDTLRGDLNRLRGTLESIVNREGSGFLTFLRNLAQAGDGALRFIAEWDAKAAEASKNAGMDPSANIFTLLDGLSGGGDMSEFRRYGDASRVAADAADVHAEAEKRRADAIAVTADRAAWLSGQVDAVSNNTEMATTVAYDQERAMGAWGARLSGAAAQYATAGGEITETNEEIAAAAEEAAEEIDAMKDAILGLGDAFTDVEAAQDGVTQSIKDARQPLRDLAEAQAELVEAREDAADDIADAEQRVADATTDASKKSARASLEDARARGASAIAAAEQEVAAAKAAFTLKGNSQAALDNRENMRAMAGQIKEAAAELLDLDKSGYSSRVEMEKGRQKFIEVATQLGLTKKEAREYANQLGLIPGKVPTDVYINGYQAALNKARTLADAINGIPRNVAVSVVTTELRKDETMASRAGQGIQPARKADGGWVHGAGTSRSDSIRALLSNGEFVTNARSASMFGPLLEAINSAGRSVNNSRSLTANTVNLMTPDPSREWDFMRDLAAAI